jgi:hypothetical protein
MYLYTSFTLKSYIFIESRESLSFTFAPTLTEPKIILNSSVLVVVVHICNTSTWEGEAEALQVQGQPGLHSEILSQKIKGWMCISVAVQLHSMFKTLGSMPSTARIRI